MSTTTTQLAYVGLGANRHSTRGTPKDHLIAAIQAIQNLPGIVLLQQSAVYSTSPQGYTDQPWFYNQVIKLACGSKWQPLELLRTLLSIEKQLGRERTQGQAQRFGPRAIDLDLLLMGNEVITTDELTLPHPRMHERAFVLVPLLELDKNLCMPDGTALADLASRLTYTNRNFTIQQ